MASFIRQPYQIVEMIPEIKFAIMNLLIRSLKEHLSCFDCKLRLLYWVVFYFFPEAYLVL